MCHSSSPSTRLHTERPTPRCSRSGHLGVAKEYQGASGLRCLCLQLYFPLSAPPLQGILCGAGTLPARTSVLSKMLLAWAVLDMDTLLDTSWLPSRGGESLLGMTSFSSSSLGSAGTWLPGPALSGMWLSRGTWIGVGEEMNAQHSFREVSHVRNLVLPCCQLNHVVLEQQSATISTTMLSNHSPQLF